MSNGSGLYHVLQGNVSNSSDVTEADPAQEATNFTGDKALYEQTYSIVIGGVLPTLCVFGFIGNVMNLIILAGKRIQRSLRRSDAVSANIGLIALAAADMLFCLTAFPSTFLPQDMVFSHQGFLLYYGCYCAAVINVFIMTSTWLTVTMASERWIAICHPLQARHILTLGRTKGAIVCVFLLSAVFNIPVFWRFYIIEHHMTGVNNTMTTYYIVNQRLVFNEKFDHAYRASWAILGNFLPLLLLVFLNIQLVRQIHKSYAMRRSMRYSVSRRASSSPHSSEDASNRITVTLVTIIVMFFILVAPSEILKQVAFLLYSKVTINNNYTYLIIEIVTNVMQTANFSANFVIYFIVNPSFRRTMKELFCFQYQLLATNSEVLDTSYVENNTHGSQRTLNGSRANSVKLYSMRSAVIQPRSYSFHAQSRVLAPDRRTSYRNNSVTHH